MDEKLRKYIDSLPRTAGVYLFYARNLDARRSTLDPIYIGKAINLRDRVKNHFLQPTYKDNLYINKITKIDFINTNSEIEALVLEAQLIKKHLPKFNVVWKDDKNYFYVAIEKSEIGVPFVYITHQPHKLKAKSYNLKAKYIGPFIEGTPLKKTLKYLRRVFPFYTTSKHPKTLCTWCHLGLCPGPVRNSPPTGPSGAPSAGGVSNGAGPFLDIVKYKTDLKKLALILQGKRKTVLFALRKEMDALAKANKFEEAGKVRDKMLALERILDHTHVIENEKSGVGDWEKTWKVMQEILGINPGRNSPPTGPSGAPSAGGVSNGTKIECYDISNIQGKNAVGSMVVFVDGVPAKSQYKKFRIRMKNEPNDIAMLNEVLNRRMQHPEWGYPQVMLIDGGKAQLNVAINTKKQDTKTKQITIISIAKGRQELFIEGKKEPIFLKDLPQEMYNLIKHLDDEAHRFAITYHKKVRKRSMGLPR